MQHEWKIGKTRNCVETRRPIKKVLYLFYNIAQRNIKKEIFRRFRVNIIYINTALSQSAFRIYKCYITIYNDALAVQEFPCAFDGLQLDYPILYIMVIELSGVQFGLKSNA